MTPTSVEEVTAAVAATDWAALLPAHRAAGDDQPVGGPTCLDALDLADGRVLLVVADRSGRVYPVPAVRDGSAVRRARPGEGAAADAVALLAGPMDGQGSHGRFRVTTWHHRAATGERPITVDQTNESVVVGDAAVVKWSVLADPGPHPAPSLLDSLAAAGFTGTPRPWGALEWFPPGEPDPRLLALVTGYLPGAVDGWTWAVDLLRQAATSGDLSPVQVAGGSVGALVGSFHLALAGTVTEGAFDAAAWRSAALADLERALSVSTGRAHDVLIAHADQVRHALEAMALDTGTGIRVHGDLHVGQVLRSVEDGDASYLLTDFEGNPVATPSERLRPQPAALDVAGTAQSIMHAGLVVRRHHPDVDPSLVDAAADRMRDAFLESYRAGTAAHPWLLEERLLRPFALRQVCREFIYAATHLPRWSHVPEAALPMLLAGARDET